MVRVFVTLEYREKNTPAKKPTLVIWHLIIIIDVNLYWVGSTHVQKNYEIYSVFCSDSYDAALLL